MKVIQVAFNFPPEIGGVGQHVWNLSNYLTKKGTEVAVITLPTTKNLHRREFTNFSIYRVSALPLPPFEPIPLNMFGLLRALVNAQNFNLVHLHGHFSFLSFFGSFLTRFLKIPYVITDHGEGLPLSLISRIHGIIRSSLMAKHVLGLSRKIISVNLYEVRALTRRYGLSRDKIIVIPNGVDTCQFNMLPTSNQVLFSEWQDKKVVLSGGVLAQWKGFEFLIHAMKLVVREDEDTRLLITGDGPDRSRLQDIVASLGLREYVKFLGYCEANLIPSYHKLSYMYVLPSIYDVCPTSVLEAMASGKPVIVTSFGGQKELVADGKNGMIVPPTDAKSLSKAMLTLLSSEDLALRMGKEGRKMVEEKFAWSKVSEKILQVYKDILSP